MPACLGISRRLIDYLCSIHEKLKRRKGNRGSIRAVSQTHAQANSSFIAFFPPSTRQLSRPTHKSTVYSDRFVSWGIRNEVNTCSAVQTFDSCTSRPDVCHSDRFVSWGIRNEVYTCSTVQTFNSCTGRPDVCHSSFIAFFPPPTSLRSTVTGSFRGEYRIKCTRVLQYRHLIPAPVDPMSATVIGLFRGEYGMKCTRVLQYRHLIPSPVDRTSATVLLYKHP